jgi:hypothetical protein
MPLLAAGDPGITLNPDGSSTALWDFGHPLDYSAENATFGAGGVNLAFERRNWTLDTHADFQNGTLWRTAAEPSGPLSLALTAPDELLVNGNFTGTTTFTNAPPWTCEQPYWGGAWAGYQRTASSGYYDDGACWNISFQDYDNAAGGLSIGWLNQSFVMPTLPTSVNISAFHGFVNTDVAVAPGAVASLTLHDDARNTTANISDSGALTASRPYEAIWGTRDWTLFNETGIQYTLSLKTVTNTSGDASYANLINPTIFHLWDNASVKFTAYNGAGRFTSEPFDSGALSFWREASWGALLPDGSNVTLRVRAGDSNNTYDSSWTPWSYDLADANGTALSLGAHRFMQVQVDLATAYTNRTPKLLWFKASYDQYHADGEIETGDFAPASVTNWGYLTHSEELAGQEVSYQYSTDGGAIWQPVPQGGDLRGVSVPSAGARIRFRARLHTNDSSVSPTVEWMRLVYVGANPSLTLECAWSDPRPVPGDAVRLEAYVNNTGAQNSSRAWLNISLPTACVDYRSWGSDSVGLTIASQQVNSSTATARFAFSDLAPGSYHLWIEASVRPGVADGATHSSGGSLSYTDPLDVFVASTSVASDIAPRAPVIRVWARCLDSELDVGDVARYIVNIDNVGNGTAPSAWLNGTLDERLSYSNSSDGLPSGGKIRWSLADIEPHQNVTLYCNASLGADASHGEGIESSFAVDYTDTAGFKRSAASDEPHASSALASNMSFVFVSSAVEVHPGDNLLATAYFNNSGYGLALAVNITMTIPETLALNGSNQAYEASGNKAYWNFSGVGPGPHSLAVTFSAIDTGVRNATAAILAEMAVTDQVGGPLGAVADGSIDISVIRVSSIWERIYWPWSGIGAAASTTCLAFALWWKFKPTPPGITDVFFIYRDGRLISHRSAGSAMRQELDTDLVSSMLTAVQQFVSDSLSEGGADGVKKLEFGEKEIYIERGASTYLAVIYTGDMNRKLNSRMRELVEKIETEHPELSEWNGNTAGLESVGVLLGELAMDWQTRGAGVKSLDEVDKV